MAAFAIDADVAKRLPLQYRRPARILADMHRLHPQSTRPRRLMAPRHGLAPLLMLACALPVEAGVYRWRDGQGVIHYGGRPPPSETGFTDLTRLRFHAQPEAIVELRAVQDGDGHLLYADNRLAGPIEVRVDFVKADNTGAEPMLPARVGIAADASALIARLHPLDPRHGGSFELRIVDAVPGSSNARPHDVEYRYPLATSTLRVEQGFGGAFSHQDEQNRHAIDLAAPIGTPVLAARDGVVMQIASDFAGAGLDREKYGGRANFVRILHDDGTMALYAHLAEDGVSVKPGQRVRSGQPIGLSGNTGFSSGPHLHFVVQVNRGMRLQSIPFRMFGPRGILRFDAPARMPPSL